MGLIWSKRKRITPTTTVSVGKTGATVSKRKGPVTLNSRGRASVRLPGGFRWRI